uniref:Apple domain-containing protein n=1 Tax=Panagrolaimus sp. JU765 TaxID=591449 RepID=A0AC34RDU3_9BILA
MANTDSNNGCVTKFDNSRLTCATAFERRPLSTESECQKLCFENILKCQSFEFNTLTATCDLYNVPPPEGVMESTRNNPKSPFSDEPLKDKNDFSYRVKRQFNSLDQQDPLKLPQFPNYCEPEVVPALGTTFYVPNLDCAPSNQFSSSSIDNNLEPLNNHQHRLPASVSSIIPTSGTKIIPEMTDCRDGGRARIQLIDGIAFVPEKSSVARIQVDSADVCLLLCRNNAPKSVTVI